MPTPPDSLLEARPKPSSPRPRRVPWVIGAGLLVLFFALVLFGVPRWGRSAQAGLQISLLSSNSLLVAITNADTNVAYQLDRTPSLESEYLFWTPHLFGVPGQTSFTVNIGITDPRGFLRSQPCLDCDQDGIENWRDASPYDTNVGLLSITIESPANGSTIQ